MPNWCSTTIVIYSCNRSEVETFHDKLHEIISKPYDSNVEAANWLGNMLMYAGYTYEETVAEKGGYPRGWINYIGDIETNDCEGVSYFYCDVEDAWDPHIKPWRCSIDKLYPNNNVKIAWLANECGCEVYLKYDLDGLFFSDSEYCMDCYCDNDTAYQKYPELQEGCEDYTAYQLMEIFELSDMNAVIKRAERITEALEDEYGEGYVYIHKYEDMDNEF